LPNWIKLVFSFLPALTLVAEKTGLFEYSRNRLNSAQKKLDPRQDKAEARLERVELSLESLEKLNQLQTTALEEHEKIINRHARWIWGLTFLSFALAIAVVFLLLQRFHPHN